MTRAIGQHATEAPRNPGRPVKKVLMLAYRFPPQGGGGVQRTLKFVKYLPQFGWLPVVHTVRNPYWPLRDATLLSEVPPDVNVYRTLTVEFERLEEIAGGMLAGRAEKGATAGEPAATRPGGRGRGGRLKRLAEFAHRRILVPDPQVAWVLPAVIKSLYIIRRERASLLYTSSPPNSCQVAGLLLKRIAKLPWVADFRDPWTEGIRRKQAYERNRGRQRLEEALERSVVTRADHVIVTTEKAAEQFVQKYPWMPGGKFSVITNGFDPADFSVAPSEPTLLAPGDFNITLTGNVEAMFDAIPFFRALKELTEEDDEIRSRLRVNFIGTKPGKYDDYIRRNDLERNVRYVAYVPHETCIRYLAESDVLFLCQIPVYESASTKLSGKLFEYLYVRKPILALTLPGLTAEILSRSGLGVVVDPNDQRGIKKALRELYGQWQAGQGPAAPDEAYLGGFDRVRQTERLSRLFDGLVGRLATSPAIPK